MIPFESSQVGEERRKVPKVGQWKRSSPYRTGHQQDRNLMKANTNSAQFLQKLKEKGAFSSLHCNTAARTKMESPKHSPLGRSHILSNHESRLVHQDPIGSGGVAFAQYMGH